MQGAVKYAKYEGTYDASTLINRGISCIVIEPYSKLSSIAFP
jgi:hypothetical protein